MKIKFLPLLLLGITAALVSCDDDDEKKLLNEFRLNGQHYDLTGGSYVVNPQTINGQTIYEWNIFLDGYGEEEEHHFHFFVYTLNEESPDGTYTYKQNGWENGKFVSHLTSVVTDVHDIEAGNIKTGTFKVAKSGEEFNITFDITYYVGQEEERIEGAMKAEFEPMVN